MCSVFLDTFLCNHRNLLNMCTVYCITGIIPGFALIFSNVLRINLSCGLICHFRLLINNYTEKLRFVAPLGSN